MRKTRCERYEQGDGHLCSIGNIIASVAGGLLGLASSGSSGEKRSETTPTWSKEQKPYVFGDKAWTPNLPQYNAANLNYALGLSGGYNPAYGPQSAQSWDNLTGGGSSGYSGTNPWYLDQEAGVGQSTPYAGIAGLLGYDAGVTPPQFSNSPYYGVNVEDPENLKTWPGGVGYSGANGTGEPGEGNGTRGKSSGSLQFQPGGGLVWGVRVGDNLLSMDEADRFRRAGLLDIEDEGGVSFNQAHVMNNFQNALLAG